MAETFAGGASFAESNSYSFIHLADRSQIMRIFQDSNDLVIHMMDGSIARHEGFFAGGMENTFLIRESDGSLWQAMFVPSGDGTVMTGFSPVELEIDAAMAETLSSVQVAQNVSAQEGVSTQSVSVDPVGSWDEYSVEIKSVTIDTGEKPINYAPDVITDDTTPRLNGVAKGMQPGDQIRIYDGEKYLGVAEVNADGTWFFDVPGASGGYHMYTARIVTAAGMESPFSGSFAMSVNAGFPAYAWIFPFLGIGAGLGFILHESNNNDKSSPVPVKTVTITHEDGTTTDDLTPNLSGTVTGFEEGDFIRIYEGETLLGTATLDESGNWAFEVPTTSAGAHNYKAVIVDAAGKEGVSSSLALTVVDNTENDAVAITSFVDDVDPSAGEFSPDEDAIDGKLYTDDTTPLLKGTVEELKEGDRVVIQATSSAEDAEPVILGDATVNEDGTWEFQIPAEKALEDGEYTFTAVITDADDKPGATSSGFVLVIDSTTPDAPGELDEVLDSVGSNTGPLESGDVTNDPMPTLSGSGVTPGYTVTIYDGENPIGTAIAGEDGTWTYTPETALEEGAHEISTTITGPNGKESAHSPGFEITVDLAADNPVAITSFVDDVDPRAGEFSPDEDAIDGKLYTDDATPLLKGTVEGLKEGESVIIQVTGSEEDAEPVILGEATVNEDGTWEFQIPAEKALEDGEYIFTAVITDADDKPGTTSSGFVLVIDSTTPDTPGELDEVLDSVGSIIDPLASGDVTDDPMPTLSGSGVTPGYTVTVYDGENPIGTAIAGEDGTWTYTPETALEEGTHEITTTVTGPNGKESEHSPGFEITVDLTAPNETDGYAISIDNDPVTNDPAPTLNGTVEGLQDGDFILIYEGEDLLGTAALGEGGIWTFDVPETDDGEHTYTAVVVDKAGNEGLSDTLTLTVDASGEGEPLAMNALLDFGGESDAIEALLAANDNEQDAVVDSIENTPGNDTAAMTADTAGAAYAVSDFTVSNGEEEDLATLLASQQLALY